MSPVRCEAYHCTLSPIACVRRQRWHAPANRGTTGLAVRPQYPECARCEQGRAVLATLEAEGLAPPAPKQRKQAQPCGSGVRSVDRW